MTNETHRHYQHRLQHQKFHIHERTTFLPMLCSRPSIRDVSFPKWKDPPASVSSDPLSPKIGCMGQVKRNNKIVGIGFPSSSSSSSHRLTNTSLVSPARFGKYSKLKRLFSGKSLSTHHPATVSSSSTKCRRSVRGRNNDESEASNSSSSVSIENMDPPLPVIKKVQGKSEEESQVDSLWKRRSGGLALKSLQLQQINHPRHHLLHPTSV